MNVLLVYAHPEPTSFTCALKEVAREALTHGGHTVEVSDLYGEGFNPVAGRHDFTGVHDASRFHYQSEQGHAHANGGFAADLVREQQRVLKADLIIWLYPIWWGGVPGHSLASWFDRVMAFGFAYADGRRYDSGFFKEKTGMLCLTTGGTVERFSAGNVYGPIDQVLYPTAASDGGISRHEIVSAVRGLCRAADRCSPGARRTCSNGAPVSSKLQKTCRRAQARLDPKLKERTGHERSECIRARPLSGKVVLITGGSRGIGAGIARRFAEEGSRVAIAYRNGKAAADAVLADVAAAGAQGIAVAGDVAKPEDTRAMVAQVVAKFGHIDVLVNCAGITGHRSFEKSDTAFFHAIFDTNVLGTVEMIQAALPHMPAPGSRIINFSSALATRPIPTTSIYAACKAAVAALSHALAKEFGPRGITVNTIAPGVIETDMTAATLVERGANIVGMTPLGRIGQPDDIAGIVVFLSSPDGKWITGRTLIADGGIS